jgi:hypothetical protein
MFRSITARLADRMSELVDEILVGDFDYVIDGDEVYADIDYDRIARECGTRVRQPAPLIDRDRRPGTVPARPAVCVSPVRPLPAAATRTN